MKLRNKKTGEIKELENIVVFNAFDEDGRSDAVYEFYSISELIENLEDYEPAKPLIKDEKIRKAVRAWAEANSITYVQYRSEELGDRFNGYDFEYICFNPWKADNLKDYGEYSIKELCGEEE